MELKEFKIQVLPLRNKIAGLVRKLLSEHLNEADDAVQEVMMKLWNKRDDLDNCRNIEAFVMTMTHHTCIDIERLRKMSVSTDNIQLSDSDTSLERLVELRDEVEIVRRIIESLPELQRITIQMKDVEGYENEEIAEITGSNVETVRSNLSRARKKVRDIYLMTVKKGTIYNEKSRIH
jgi:RNA polymerase sigma-70 factor (ECF subfamily)